MKNYLFFTAAVALAAALAFSLLGRGEQAQAAGAPQVISVFGKVPGTNLAVHITAVVPEGRSAQDVTAEVLAAYRARPFDSADFSLTGLNWDTDNDSSTPPDVTQNYNAADDPTTGTPSGGDALHATQGTWTAATAYFEFSNGGSTDRCPSLVEECDGAQTFDTFNDVAWLALSDKNVLGVTWFSTSGSPEADMALNTSFRWTATLDNDAEGREGGCRGPARKCYVFDAQTVFLHENGHVTGLGHSSIDGAVMEPAYEGPRRALHQDDKDGLTALYGSGGGGGGQQGSAVTVMRPSGTDGYDTSGGRNGDRHLGVTVELDDDTGAAVSGASVTILLDLMGSPRAWSGTATTGAEGMVTFTLSNAPSGCYTTTVTDVTASGLTWNGNTPNNLYAKGGATC